MNTRTCFAAVTLLLTLAGSPAHLSADDREAATDLPRVLANDNRRAAGALTGQSLSLSLRAAAGSWRPEGDGGPVLTVEAFGEVSGELQVPAPLIRVSEGTEIVASVKNDLDAVLRVHGLCARDDSTCAPIDVPPAERREVRFVAGRAGTYHYWATTTGMPLSFRGGPDAALSGAFIVDPPGAIAGTDRVLVLTEWTSLTRTQLRDLAAADDPGVLFRKLNPGFTFLINGLSWPATERLRYTLGDDVNWRVVNLSSQQHPMHLHGFYFEVAGLGDGVRDITFDPSDRQKVVTRLLAPGATMAVRWRAERIGNWLLHCHISDHIAPERRLAPAPASSEASDWRATEAQSSTTPAHGAHHAEHGEGHEAMGGMAGMVLGITIAEQAGASAPVRGAPISPARAITLVMQTEAGRYGAAPAFGFALAEGDAAPAAGKVTVPGPTLTLRRGEPVEITLVNHLPEATAIHWHGMELDSYFDGVHGWSGAGAQVTPLIQPGQSFTVSVTPPRAGTFIYHTHLHDDRQLTSGMYGAMLVLEPGEQFDPALDHVFVIGRAGVGRAPLTVLNGEREPQFFWKAGARHRMRLINITPNDIFVASLSNADGPLTWQPVSKDGAPVPASQDAARPATLTIAVGETYDFIYDAPAGRQTIWLNVRTPAGRWQVQGRIGLK